MAEAKARSKTQDCAPKLQIYLLLITLVADIFGCCYGNIVRIPVTKVHSCHGYGDRVKRDVEEKDGVRQMMEGISGEGYFINITIGTPPQEVGVVFFYLFLSLSLSLSL